MKFFSTQTVLTFLLAAGLAAGCKPTQPKSSSASLDKLTPEEREALKKEIMADIKAEQEKEREEHAKKRITAEDRMTYMFRPEKTIFKYAGFNMGRLYYTPSGKMAADKITEPTFYVISAMVTDTAKIGLQGRKKYFDDLIQNNFMGFKAVEGTFKPIVVDTVKGFEQKSVLKSKEEGKEPEYAFHRILFGTGYYIFMVGVAPMESEKYLPEFEKIANTFYYRIAPGQLKEQEQEMEKLRRDAENEKKKKN